MLERLVDGRSESSPIDDNTCTDIISYSETLTVIPYWQSYSISGSLTVPMQPCNATAYRSHVFTDIPSHIIQLSSQYVANLYGYLIITVQLQIFLAMFYTTAINPWHCAITIT